MVDGDRNYENAPVKRAQLFCRCARGAQRSRTSSLGCVSPCGHARAQFTCALSWLTEMKEELYEAHYPSCLITCLAVSTATAQSCGSKAVGANGEP